MPKKLFILDTSVLLHNPSSLFQFKEHDVVICLAVIDDLDRIKSKPESIGYSAREVLRTLDRINPSSITTGIPLTDEGGQLFIYNHELPNIAAPTITKLNSDNSIIEAAIKLQDANIDDDVIIVSKDTGLRIRAAAWNCKVENYQSDLVDTNYTGILYEDVYNIDDLLINQYVINGVSKIRQKTNLGMIDIPLCEGKNKLSWVGIGGKNPEQHCAISALTNMNIELVCLTGAAGSGKTIISIAAALSQIFDGKYDKLIFMKPIVAFGGKDIGALPGDKNEKLGAWYKPLEDNISQLDIKKDKPFMLSDLIEANLIEMEVMTYIQGRSIPNSIIICDESQNISQREARMLVERCSKNSKIIFLGDMSQIENPYLDKRSCGLAHAINGSKNLANCATITFNKVERSALSAMASEIFSK